MQQIMVQTHMHAQTLLIERRYIPETRSQLRKFPEYKGKKKKINKWSEDRTGVDGSIHQSLSHYTTVNAAASCSFVTTL